MHYWSKSGRHGRQIAVLALSVLLGAIAWPSGVGADAAPRDSTASARAPSGRVLAPAYSITDLGTLPGGGASFATDINAVGQIVGYAEVPTTGYTGWAPFATIRAVVWRNGVITAIGPDVSRTGGSAAQSINQAGLVIGYTWAIGGSGKLFYTGFTYDTRSGTFTATDRTSINTPPPVDRQYNPERLALLQQAQTVDLSQLLPPGSGWTALQVSGVNQRGQIVGSGTHNGQTRAFLLTPLPGAGP